MESFLLYLNACQILLESLFDARFLVHEFHEYLIQIFIYL